MNIRVVIFVLGNLLLLLGGCLLAPLLVTLIYYNGNAQSQSEVFAFLLSSVVALGLGALGRFRFRVETPRIRIREGFAVVTFSWLSVVVIGMLPYLFSGLHISLSDAFFETMSGFTTTGATIFERVEILPHGLQFWRCMTQWLGGMGIVVLSVALLPMLGAGGYRMLKAETPGGVAFERERPKITDIAKELWHLYVLLSAMEVLLLYFSGMSLFDAFCHTFATMSTGGFSPHSESMAFYPGAFTQWIIIVFMFLAGTNFSIHAQVLKANFSIFKGNREFQLYVGIVVLMIGIGLWIVPFENASDSSVRAIAFHVISIGTTTGFATHDFDSWPHLMRLLLVLSMFVGGCMGSTAGGMKVARFLIFAKALVRELYQQIYPHAVQPIRVGDRIIESGLVKNILAFGFLFVAAFVFGAIVMTAHGYDLVTSLSASVAALANIGPGLGEVGPTKTWAHLPELVKWVMSFLMLVGRLELFSVLILFTPWAWRR